MFIAYVIQEGEGCDYTIGCGNDLWYLEAETQKEAIEELKSLVIGKLEEPYGTHYGGHWADLKLESVRLFEVVNESNVEINRWYEEASQMIAKAITKQKEEEERALLERLKEKYNKE